MVDLGATLTQVITRARAEWTCHSEMSRWPEMRNEASKCEWRHAPEARGVFLEILKKSLSWDETCFGWGDGWFSLARGDLCGRCHTCWGGGGWRGQNRKILPLSPCVEEPLNSKVIKSFVPEQRSRSMFFEFQDSYVLSLWTFAVHFAYLCIWLCSNTKESKNGTWCRLA